MTNRVLTPLSSSASPASTLSNRLGIAGSMTLGPDSSRSIVQEERSQNEQPYLLQRMAAGEHEVLGTIEKRYGDRIRELARRLLPKDVDLDGAVQEALISVWRAAHRFDPTKTSSKSPELSFILMVARRRLIEKFIRRKRHKTSSIDTHDCSTVSVEDRSERSRSTDKSEAQRILLELGKLPEKQRDALLLRYCHRMSEEQVAEALGEAVGTTKSTLSRAKRELRRRLDNSNRENGLAFRTNDDTSNGGDSAA